MLGIGDGATLGYGAVLGLCDVPLGSNVFRELVGRDVASIPCRVLISCIFSSPTVNRNYGDILLSASSRFSTSWRAKSVDERFWTGQLCSKNSTVLTILSARVSGT